MKLAGVLGALPMRPLITYIFVCYIVDQASWGRFRGAGDRKVNIFRLHHCATPKNIEFLQKSADLYQLVDSLNDSDLQDGMI
jgi:hypothetical protein